MKIINFEEKICQRIRRLLDGHLSQELTVESSLEVKRHLETCRICSEALFERTRVSAALRQAVQLDLPPPELRTRIQSRLRRPRPSVVTWGMAAAAAIFIGLGGWYALKWFALDTPLRPETAIAAALQIGLDDHIHCAVNGRGRNIEYTDAEMAADLGPQHTRLAPLVKSLLPADLRLTAAHKCRFRGREYIHLIAKREDQTASIIITAKNGGGFPALATGTKLDSGVEMHGAFMQNFEVAGFETSTSLVYIISNLPAVDHRQIAAGLAAPVRDFLARLDS